MDLVKITLQGQIVTYCNEILLLSIYDINGKLEKQETVQRKLTAMIISKDGKYLITGDEVGAVVVRRTTGLEVVRGFEGNDITAAQSFLYSHFTFAANIGSAKLKCEYKPECRCLLRLHKGIKLTHVRHIFRYPHSVFAC